MKRFWTWPALVFLFAMLASFAFGCFAHAGWGASCGPVGLPRMLPAAVRVLPPAREVGKPLALGPYEWGEFADHDPDEICLRRNGKQVGTYRYSTATYKPRVGEGFGEACDPPCPLPNSTSRAGGTPPESADDPNYGLIRDQIQPGRTTINGKEVTKAQAFAAISADVPNDAKTPRIVVIGDEASCTKVLTDFATLPAFASYKGKYIIQDYRPSDWPVSSGFVTSGNPTIYCETADGTVLHRQDGYDGPEKLATALGRLRKADPNYDPKKDPDASAPTDSVSVLLGKLKDVPVWVWVVVGGGVLFYLSRRR